MAKKKTQTLEEALVPENEQPYAVPGNWVWTRIESVSDIYTGNSINSKTKQEKYTGNQDGLDYIATKDVGFDSTISYENGIRIPDYNKFKIAPANTTLLCIEGGSAGRKIGFTVKDVCFGNKLCAFISKDIDSKLIYYYLQSSYFSDCFQKEHHGLIGGVSVNLLKEIPFPLPPLAEQRRIVARIESLFEKLDHARELVQTALDSFETRKAAILHKAFTGELTAQWRAEHGLGMDSWEMCALEKYFDVVGGIQKTPARQPRNNKFPYLAVSNVLRNELDLSEIRYFELQEGEIDKYTLKPLDLLIVEGNGSAKEIGRCAVWNGEIPNCVHQNHIIRMRACDDKINPAYVNMFLNSEQGKTQMKEKAKTTAGLYNLSVGKIKSVELSVATLPEQQEIVRILDSLLEKEQKAKEQLEPVLEQIDLMKKSILARAFRGELGTNDPSEESAVGLLRERKE